MKRSDPADRTLLSAGDPADRINANQFDFGWAPGIDVQIAANRPGGLPVGVELQFTSIQEYSAQFTIEDGSGVRFVTANPDATGGTTTIDYASNFNSFAVNFRRIDSWQSISLGLRVAELEETMSGLLMTNAQRIDWQTSNTFVGFQGGAPHLVDLNVGTLSMFGR